MSKWTARLIVVNTTDQDLKLVNKYVYSENTILSFPDVIPAKSKGIFEVATPFGKPLGPEFKITLAAQGTEKQNPLGSFDFHIDIPYWSPTNTLNYHCNRDLICQVIPSMIHDREQSYNGKAVIAARELTNLVNYKVLNEKIDAKSWF